MSEIAPARRQQTALTVQCGMQVGQEVTAKVEITQVSRNAARWSTVAKVGDAVVLSGSALSVFRRAAASKPAALRHDAGGAST